MKHSPKNGGTMFTHKIVFTGGGSAGHVTPNIAIINELNRTKWDIHYIGSHKGIERELIQKIDIPYHPISSGKLRRYIDFENIKDVFRVIRGILGARSILKKIKPNVVFSKGGFVSVPVILAARSLKIPCLIHESDLTPGLANKISKRFASKIFTSFDETAKHFPATITKAIGSPIRRELLHGSKQKGLDFITFDNTKPVLLIMGGSLGATKINEAVRNGLSQLTEQFQIVHLCGKGNINSELASIKGYLQFEYVNEELADILAATDYVLTRGGSNAIFEFLALKIPMLIIPLPKSQSRGDQILNAKNFTENGYALTLEEESLTTESLMASLDELQRNTDQIKQAMSTTKSQVALDILIDEITMTAKKRF